MAATAITASLSAQPSANAGGPFAERDPPADKDAPGPLPHGVSLDARTGRLVCPSLGLEADEFTGRITQSRLVRAFGNGRDERGQDEEEGGEKPGNRLASANMTFAHTLSAAGTVSFTRYALALRREGLLPQEVLTRLSVEELRWPGPTTLCRCLRFEKIGLPS